MLFYRLLQFQKTKRDHAQFEKVVKSFLKHFRILLLFSIILSIVTANDFCENLNSITRAALENFQSIADWKAKSSSRDVFMDTSVELVNSKYSHILRFGKNTNARSFPAGMTIYKTWLFRDSPELDNEIIQDYQQVMSDIQLCLPSKWQQLDLASDEIYKMQTGETLAYGTIFKDQETDTLI